MVGRVRPDRRIVEVIAMNAGNAEGVKELSPGWRFGGTLGTHINTRTALKERKRTGSVSQLSSSSNEQGRFMTCVRIDSFALSELCAFVIDTQGSAKPPPWAKFFHAFSVPSVHGNHLHDSAVGTDAPYHHAVRDVLRPGRSLTGVREDR
jgi:hypothetical protein